MNAHHTPTPLAPLKPGRCKPELHEPNQLDTWALRIYSFGLGLIVLSAILT